MYQRVLGLSHSNVDACMKATCVLHNYLRRSFQEPLWTEMGTPNGQLPDVTRPGANDVPRQALQVWENLSTYFSSPAGGPMAACCGVKLFNEPTNTKVILRLFCYFKDILFTK